MDEKTREILLILQEEAVEVAKEISKIMRFGIDRVKPGKDISNIQALQEELGDLQAMIDLLINQNVGVTIEGLEQAKEKKYQKLKKWSNIFTN